MSESKKIDENSTEKSFDLKELENEILGTTQELDQLKTGLEDLSIEEKNEKLEEIEKIILDCSDNLKALESDNTISVSKEKIQELKSMIDALKIEHEVLKKQVQEQTDSALEELSQTITMNNEKGIMNNVEGTMNDGQGTMNSVDDSLYSSLQVPQNDNTMSSGAKGEGYKNLHPDKSGSSFEKGAQDSSADLSASEGQTNEGQTISEGQSSEGQTDLEGQSNEGEKKGGLRKWREGLTDGQRRGVRIGGGVLAGLGIWKLGKRIFGGKDKSDSEKNRSGQTEKKPFWDRRYGKALKWTGIGSIVYYVARGLSTGNWDIFGWKLFSKDKKEGPTTTPGSKIERSEKAYENLSEEDKQIYESSADGVNEYYANVTGSENGVQQVEDMMGDSDFDMDKKGLIPFMLSNRYNTMENMLSESAFYYEIIGTEGHIARNKLKSWSLDGLKTLLSPLVGIVNGLTLDILNLDEGRDNLIEKLKGMDGLEEKLRIIFRKSIMVMSYYQSRKGMLENYLAEQILLQQNPNFSSLSEEEKLEEINDHLEDGDRYKQNIESEISNFMKLNLKEATIYLKERNLLNGELDPTIKKEVEKVEKDRMDLLGIDDEDDDSILEGMKLELKDGSLSERSKDKLKELCKDFEEELFTSGKQVRYAKYLPMFKILGADSQFLYDIQQTGDYENIANMYKEQIDSILKKIEDGTLQESDLELLEETINDYYKFKKSLITSEINVGKFVDENGNIVYRRGRSVCAGGQNIWSGIQIILDKGKWGEGLGLIGGGIISIDALTFGWAGKKIFGFSPFWALNKKVVFPIARTGLNLSWKGIERLTGNKFRASMPSFISAGLYDKDTFRIAVGKGEISLEKAAKIAHRKGFTFGQVGSGNGKLVETPEHVIQYMFGSTEQEAQRVVNVVKKYGDNHHMYRELFNSYYDKVPGRWRKPKEWLHLNRANKKFELNEQVLQRLENVASRIDSFPGVKKKVLQSMMTSVKTVEQAENFAIMGIGDDMGKLLESGKFMKPEQYGKYLARYAGKIDANDLRKFENFIIQANETNKVGENKALFVRNAMKNFDRLKKNNFALDKIDDFTLNSNKWMRLSEKMKLNCTKRVNQLREMVKNPKFRSFKNRISAQANAIEEFRQGVTPEGVKAMDNMKLFGHESVFSRLSEQGMHELGRLSYMMRDVDIAKDLSKSLKGAKTLDEIKDVLRQKGIAVEHIDDGVLLKIAKTKDAQKIKNIINYGAEYKSIQGLQKLTSNPAFKAVGRTGGKVLVGLDFLLVGYNFYSNYSEAQAIKTQNLERGEWKDKQAYFELGAGGLGAAAGVCMFVPGIGWIAAGVLGLSIAASEIGKKYYEDIEKFKQNQADFLEKGIQATKQELTSVDSRDQGLSRTWIDKMNLFGSRTKKEIGSPQTKSEALKALIKMEELQKNPLAGADLNDPEVVKDPQLVEAIRQAKQQVEEIVQKRFEYFKINYLDKKIPLVRKAEYEGNQVISAIDNLLEKSSMYYIMGTDTSYQGEKDIEKYKDSKKQELEQLDRHLFEKLEKLFEQDKTFLLQMYAELPYYRSMLVQFGDENMSELMGSCDFFEKYINYKMMGKSISDYPTININPDDIDYNLIHNFMLDFEKKSVILDRNEVKKYKGISDEEILEKYGISGILGQDILFECANLLNYNGKNNLEDLKMFFNESNKGVNGIYYNGKHWVINENNAKDDKFANDSELNNVSNIEKMRKSINLNINGSFVYGSMFTESSPINKEIGNKMLNIIDGYLDLRKNSKNFYKKVIDYVKNNSSGNNYIALPPDLLILARKSGLKHVGEYSYKYENGKLYKTK